MPLTRRQREVYRLLAHGSTTPEIMAALHIKSQTARNYYAALRRATGCRSTRALVCRYWRHQMTLAYRRGLADGKQSKVSTLTDPCGPVPHKDTREEEAAMDNYETYRSKPVTIRACGPIAERVLCRTHNGDAWAEVGHYIIREPDGVGEYPCDPETFRRRWEKV